MKKTGVLILLVAIVGCTAEMKNNLGQLNLSSLVQVVNAKEALLAHAFVSNGADQYAGSRLKNSMRNFTQQEEDFAQKSLSTDKEGQGVKWDNDLYGELVFYPGRRYQQNQWQCRDFKIMSVVISIGVKEEKNEGSACLNPRTSRWEWAGFVTGDG